MHELNRLRGRRARHDEAFSEGRSPALSRSVTGDWIPYAASGINVTVPGLIFGSAATKAAINGRVSANRFGAARNATTAIS